MTGKYGIGAVVLDKWRIVRKLGEGSFGTVYEIQREEFGQTYTAALKVITVPRSGAEYQAALDEGMSGPEAERYFYGMVEEIVREFAIMAKLKGMTNVVSCEDQSVIRHKDGVGWDVLIRMELLTPLLTYAYEHPFARRDVIRLGIDMCRALELCQKYNIIHRDIKPENIFVSAGGDFKLGDFGIARTVEKTVSGLSKKGTYNYMAPEVYRSREYGFSVDTYSLGVVLYRLLNNNRLPFLPQPPEPITYHKREEALARRMNGETPPPPCYGEGRLGEIVLKACAFDPKDRYESPALMRQALEGVLYDARDAALIYPSGDDLAIRENGYVSHTPQEGTEDDDQTATERTESAFGSGRQERGADPDASRTEHVFGGENGTERTESAFGKKDDRKKPPAGIKTKEKPKKKPVVLAIVGAVLTVAAGAVILLTVNGKQRAKRADYESLLARAGQVCDTDPQRAQSLYEEAHGLYPTEIEPQMGYAYALYRGGSYAECVTYIEDSLALGKAYDTDVQSKLAEILAAAYFEQEDYASAAAFFRLSTAGGDLTVPAMRDYAVSLGRLGDVSAADEVLQRMYDAGASGDVTDYVQAEVDRALEDYAAAESGFRSVLDSTEDESLQKRALRALAETYRDCAVLARTGDSPIDYPATKEAELLSDGIVRCGLSYDSTLWEMLALAYFEAYHTDASAPDSYLTNAADCFERVISMGVQAGYLYSDLYAIYYEQQDYDKAEQALAAYETAFPDDYLPHALRGMMLITIENEKSQSQRDYTQAAAEYDKAGSMLRSGDDRTYYQQLESLIGQLRTNGWL